ncbi:MAG: KTSC domain-containing protein [Desulfosporosinus sp.]|nr:KTSC domain-containing protein [Desulfosporosinus sp.]
MEWVLTVSSSNVEQFRYDEDSQTLEVEFKSGARYQYFDVPNPVYEGFVSEANSGGSAGKYLNLNIKGHYRYAKV